MYQQRWIPDLQDKIRGHMESCPGSPLGYVAEGKVMPMVGKQLWLAMPCCLHEIPMHSGCAAHCDWQSSSSRKLNSLYCCVDNGSPSHPDIKSVFEECPLQIALVRPAAHVAVPQSATITRSGF